MDQEEKLRKIPIERIHPSKLQIRCEYDAEALKRLAESLKREGQLRSIMVRPHPELEGEFEVVFGHRTLEAARMAGLKHLTARVEQIDDEEVMWIQWAENELREDISDYERALWLRRMMERFGYTQAELAGRLGRDPSWVSRHLRMLELEGVLPRGNLIKLSEGAVRSIFQQPRSFWPRIAARIKEHFKAKGVPPSASEVRDFIWEASMEAELSRARATERAEQEIGGEEAPREVAGAPKEAPQEFIARTRELWPGVTEEFLVDSLVTRFGLSEDEAKEELRAYGERRAERRQVFQERAEKVECPLCGRRGADLLTIQAKYEELREFHPELRTWEWILREVAER